MSKVDWVIVGGKPGESGWCTRCGEGLNLNMPQRIEVFVAASKAFVRAHAHCKPGQYFEKPAHTPEQWKRGRDTGISSMTIYQAITGDRSDGSHFDIPYDPDDFGRCYRLLKLFPSWRPQLAKVIDICPEWKPFVEAWDELTQMFEAVGPDRYDLASPRRKGTKAEIDAAQRMYDRMKQLEALSETLSPVGDLKSPMKVESKRKDTSLGTVE